MDQQLNVTIGSGCSEPGSAATGNVMPLLHEIRHALAGFVDHGDTTVIDLRAIPMGPGEEDRLLELLGRGEVSIRLDSLGPSDIVETNIPGVWLVTHYNAADEIIGRFIEICACPAIVSTQGADARAGLGMLEQLLQ